MNPVPAALPELRECPGCGRFQILPDLAPGMIALCERCPTTLRRAVVHSHDVSIALNLAALILLVILCSSTLLSVQTAGIMLQAGLFQWVNPKAWIIALGAVATYTTAEGVLGQSLLLALIFVLVTFPAVAFWTLTGVGAARLFRGGRSLRAFNLVMAALLVLSLLPVLRAL